jgi:hypothetical protein
VEIHLPEPAPVYPWPDLTETNSHLWHDGAMRSFFILWSGQAVSRLGSQIVQFALIWYLTTPFDHPAGLDCGYLKFLTVFGSLNTFSGSIDLGE